MLNGYIPNTEYLFQRFVDPLNLIIKVGSLKLAAVVVSPAIYNKNIRTCSKRVHKRQLTVPDLMTCSIGRSKDIDHCWVVNAHPVHACKLGLDFGLMNMYHAVHLPLTKKVPFALFALSKLAMPRWDGWVPSSKVIAKVPGLAQEV